MTDGQTAARANLDAAAANLRLEIVRRFTDARQRARAIAALDLVVEISAEVMMGRPRGQTTH